MASYKSSFWHNVAKWPPSATTPWTLTLRPSHQSQQPENENSENNHIILDKIVTMPNNFWCIKTYFR